MLAALLLVYVQVLIYSRPDIGGDNFRYDQFINNVENGRIQNARILDQDSYVVGRYRRPDGSVHRFNTPYLKAINTRERLVDTLGDNRVPLTIDQQFAKSLVGPLTFLLPALMLVVATIYLVTSWRRGTGLFGMRSGARRIMPGDTSVSFADVAGQDAAVRDLREISHFLAEPERFAGVGAKIPKGIMLYGPPGCGKTLLARALAGEAGASFYSISGSDFVEMFVGVGAARVRDLFKEAREDAPAIVFIDELDSVGRRRGAGSAATGSGSGEEQEQALNQILAEMDGFSTTQGIIVLGATNRPDILDPALLRPGRFDRAIGLERPDEKGRLAILEIHARGKPLAPDASLETIARRAVGLSGADLESLINEAALLSARAERRSIAQEELELALTRIVEAPERQRRLSMRARSLGQRSTSEERVTFDDVAGLELALDELAEVKEYLADPGRFADMGARIPRGFLLTGPPGCGKTLLARAVAGEANAAFVSVAGSELVEVFTGEGAARVRDLFAEARAAAPAIIFIDELDAIGARRGASPDGNRETEQTLNQILIELDGFGQRTSVLVMAASNRADILDPALIRPGRFDRTITLSLPDRPARLEILTLHAKGKRLGPDVDLKAVAGLTTGFAGADLAGIMNEGALLAARRRETHIRMAFLEEAIERISSGISTIRVLSEAERRTVAYHEAGHALVARALPVGKVPHRISIVSRGTTLGSTWVTDETERMVHTRSGLIDEMAILLGGRVAEQIVYGETTSSASDDLRRVGAIARQMVVELGMSSRLGPLPHADVDGASNGAGRYSEETARVIDTEERRLVDEAERKTRAILEASRGELERLAARLMERETVSAAELDQIVGPAPVSAQPSMS